MEEESCHHTPALADGIHSIRLDGGDQVHYGLLFGAYRGHGIGRQRIRDLLIPPLPFLFVGPLVAVGLSGQGTMGALSKAPARSRRLSSASFVTGPTLNLDRDGWSATQLHV
jgi:hypothetical protein